MPHPDDMAKGFLGVCPFHKGCLEGMAAGPSIEARTGVRGERLDQEADVWDIQAFYIAQAALQATMLYRPRDCFWRRCHGARTYGVARA